MKSYFGSFYFPGSSTPVESTVLIFDKILSIGYRDASGSNATINWLLRDLTSHFDPGADQTRVRHLTNPGYQLHIEGAGADNFIKEMQAEQSKAWYRKSSGQEWIRNSLLLLGIAGLFVIVYLLMVPWLSSKLAGKVSVNTEQQIGEAVYNAMDLGGKEDTTASYALNHFFNEMHVTTEYPIRITVIRDNTVNAFALPGGRIVIYSALIDQLKSYPELAALLSHEFTHVNNKHTTRSIFRKLGSRVFLGLLFGRFGTVSTIVVEHADNLKSLKYSRKLEKEADLQGLALLAERKIDPQGFVDLLDHLKKASVTDHSPEFLDSHPDISKRISYIREASADMVVWENQRLKKIFEDLKNK